MLTSGDGLLEKVEDRLLLEFGGLGPDTPAACGPSGEIGRCRTVVVRRAGVGAGAQECVYRSRTTVPHCSMQRRNPASGSCVRVSARVNQIGDDRPLAGRIPVRGAGFADDRRVQRFGTAPVTGADVSASRNQITGEADVVGERRRVQRSIAFVDLRVTLRNEELVTAAQAGGGQRRGRVKRCGNERVIARRDRD
jgi:hypothetical protein